MTVLPLSKRLVSYIQKHNLTKTFVKQKSLFEQNPAHASLHTELLEPRHLRIYSFRVTKRYRAIFIYHGNSAVEIIDINDHYQ